MEENVELEIDSVIADQVMKFVEVDCADEFDMVKDIINASNDEFHGIPGELLEVIITTWAESVLYKYLAHTNLDNTVERLFNAKMAPGETA